jgi:hypothetical protein
MNADAMNSDFGVTNLLVILMALIMVQVVHTLSEQTKHL